MIVGIHPDRTSAESYSDKWVEFLQARGVEVQLLDLLAPDALEQAAECDGVMWRWLHRPQDKQSAQRILYVIEHYLGKPVFPNTRTAWHYDEKVAQYYLLQALGAPTARTWVFWDYARAVEWAHTAPYPVVFKLSVGAGASNVVKVENDQVALSLIQRAFHHGIFPSTMNEYAYSPRMVVRPSALWAFVNRIRPAIRYLWWKDYPPLGKSFKPEKEYVYFQEFLDNNEYDTRITVIGDRAFGFRRQNRPEDFRASGSGKIEHEPTMLDPRCIEIAFDISSRGNFQSMAYDFLYRDGEPLISEISYTFADWAVHDCPGHWHKDMSWQNGHMWPEEAQVELFLRQIKVRQAD